jgi:hypothetical protein
VKITGGQNLFTQRSNFSSGLAEKFCKELATLVLLSHQSFAAMSLAVLRIRDVFGSRIPDPKSAMKDRGEKIFIVIPFFWSHKFHKIELFYF